jgi:formylglycine-generating enzyme required for sulfatase activity
LVRESTAEVRFIPGGTFRMGSDRHYPEEASARQVGVNDFWIDRTPVTNRQFRKFVNETGHVTLAELSPDAKDYPGALPEMLKAGSLIFSAPRGPVDLRDCRSGGGSSSAPTGDGRMGRAARSAALTIIRSFTSPIATPRPTRHGPARRCRPKPNGNWRRAADWMAPNSPGAKNSRRAANIRPTPGRANFHGKISRSTATSGPRRSPPFRRTATAFTT